MKPAYPCTRRRFLIATAATAFAVPLAQAAPAQQTKPARPPAGNGPGARSAGRVLLVTGQDYPGHLWRLTAPALAAQLRQDPRLQVHTIEDPHFLDSSALLTYDTMVLHFMNWEQPAPGPRARQNLQQAIASGKGLLLLHFACGAFQDWPEFAKLVGRVYDPKLRPHDPRGPFTVRIVDDRHPITQGLGDFDTDDELYTCLAGEQPIQVLATARSKIDGKDYPMAFVLNYGQGRVFHTVLGHDVKALTFPGVTELLRRAAAWTAGLPPVGKRETASP